MTSVSKLRILIADDHALVREGLKRLINDQPDMVVVAEAGDGHDALRLAQEHVPDVAFVDISMPGLDGARVTQLITNTCPQVKVIAVTRHDDASYVRRLLDAGAVGYVLKQSAASELTRAVRAVAAGHQFVDRSFLRSIRGIVPPSPPDSSPVASTAIPGEPLTSQEEAILRLLASVYTHQEIATSLSMDVTEVLVKRVAAMSKTRLATRADVVRYAQARGWLGGD